MENLKNVTDQLWNFIKNFPGGPMMFAVTSVLILGAIIMLFVLTRKAKARKTKKILPVPVEDTTKKKPTPESLGLDKDDIARLRKWWTPLRKRRYQMKKLLDEKNRLEKMEAVASRVVQ